MNIYELDAVDLSESTGNINIELVPTDSHEDHDDSGDMMQTSTTTHNYAFLVDGVPLGEASIDNYFHTLNIECGAMSIKIDIMRWTGGAADAGEPDTLVPGIERFLTSTLKGKTFLQRVIQQGQTQRIREEGEMCMVGGTIHAFQQGFTAAKKKADTNPYPEGSPQHKQWMMGYKTWQQRHAPAMAEGQKMKVKEISSKLKKSYIQGAKKDIEFDSRGVERALGMAANARKHNYTGDRPGQASPAEWNDEADFLNRHIGKREKGIDRAMKESTPFPYKDAQEVGLPDVQPGDFIRTRKMMMGGVVEKLKDTKFGCPNVYFRTEDGRLMKTPLSNVRVEKKASVNESAERWHKEGHSAHGKGKKRADNPYKEGSDAARNWAQGYTKASDGKEPEKFVGKNVKESSEHPTKKGYTYDPELSDKHVAGFSNIHGDQAHVKRHQLPKDHPEAKKDSVKESAGGYYFIQGGIARTKGQPTIPSDIEIQNFIQAQRVPIVHIKHKVGNQPATVIKTIDINAGKSSKSSYMSKLRAADFTMEAHDVDHMNGPVKNKYGKQPLGCKTCSGHGHIYTGATQNKHINPGKGAKRVPCPDCSVKESVGMNTSKPYGVRYKVFAGKEGRLTTKEAWFATEQQLKRAVERIENLGNFYEIDGYSHPGAK